MRNLSQLSYNVFRFFYERTPIHYSVIEDISDEELKAAYSYCRSITKHHAKTFYMATRFLPNEKQRGVFAIYAYCRYVDNLVDEAEDLIQQKNLSETEIYKHIELFKQQLEHTYSNGYSDNTILIAFCDALKNYNISIELPLLLIEGVRMDLVKTRYKNFDEIFDYSYKVASVVGLMICEVFDYKDEIALDYAVDLGIAMQLTNILRDVGEDLQKGRIYLPEDELQQFNVSEKDLFSFNLNDAFRDLMKYQIERTRKYYQKAKKGVPFLSKDSQHCVLLAYHNYSRILNKIEKNDYDVFNQRAYLNFSEKLLMVPQVFVAQRRSN